jgi:hypothetical protein
LRDSNSFPGRQAVSFYDYGQLEIPVELDSGGFGTITNNEPRGGNPVTSHELLRKNLAAFEPGGGLSRPDDAQALAGKQISDALYKGNFRTHYRQIDAKLASETGQSADIVGASRKAFSKLRNAGVSRRAEQLDRPCTLAEFPNDGMFTASRPDYQYLHHRRILSFRLL